METERSSSKHHVLKKVGTALCRSREIMHGKCCFEHFLKILFFSKKGGEEKIIHCLVPDHWFLSCLRRAGHELGTVCWAPFVGTRTNETLICIRTIYQWAHSSFFSSWSLSCPTFSGWTRWVGQFFYHLLLAISRRSTWCSGYFAQPKACGCKSSLKNWSMSIEKHFLELKLL